MNYIELTIYVVIPEALSFVHTVEREAMVIIKGHPRVVVPLANMIQGAAQVLGSRGSEGEAKTSPDAPESKSKGVKGKGNSK